MKNIFLFFIMFMVTAVIFSTGTAYAADYNQVASKVNVEPDKSWSINFNTTLDGNTVTKNNIYVKDQSGNLVDVILKLENDSKTVTITSVKKYESGKTYCLYIEKGLKNASGRPLDNGLKMEFVIKNYQPSPEKKSFKVCIDAGHGGVDAGEVGQGGTKEKDVTLNVALKLGELLKKQGIEVTYTRTSDNVSWGKNEVKPRFNIAEQSKSNFYITLHCNSVGGNLTATGVETLYLDTDSKGKQMSELIQKELSSITGLRDRGEKGSSNYDINGINVPSAKVLLGFITSPEDEAKLKDESLQCKMAEGIAKAVVNYSQNNTNEITVTSAADKIASVVQGESFNLPNKINVKLSDGSYSERAVTWETTTVDTSKPGTYAYEGRIDGYSKKVILTLIVVSKGDSRYSVCLDAGHGGFDPGTHGSAVQEKDITLAVTLKTGKILESEGVRVVYTRTSDVISFPREEAANLQARCDISDVTNVNYFVSIHCNSASPLAQGIETYYALSEGPGPAKNLATAIQEELINVTGAVNRGVKQNNYYVLENTIAPSSLTELGFLTNEEEQANLMNEEYQNKVAAAIAKGILRCLGK